MCVLVVNPSAARFTGSLRPDHAGHAWVLGTFSGGPVFAFFAVMMLLQLVFVLFLMPETRNVSLEELQRHLVGDNVKLRRVHLSSARAHAAPVAGK